MIKYGIGILPLIKDLKREIPDATQPWLTDGARALGTFARIETYFNLLTRQGPGGRYDSKPFKSVLIVHMDNIRIRKEFGARHGFKVCIGARYLGSYIRDDKTKIDWMRERMMTWEEGLTRSAKPRGNNPRRVTWQYYVQSN